MNPFWPTEPHAVLIQNADDFPIDISKLEKSNSDGNDDSNAAKQNKHYVPSNQISCSNQNFSTLNKINLISNSSLNSLKLASTSSNTSISNVPFLPENQKSSSTNEDFPPINSLSLNDNQNFLITNIPSDKKDTKSTTNLTYNQIPLLTNIKPLNDVSFDISLPQSTINQLSIIEIPPPEFFHSDNLRTTAVGAEKYSDRLEESTENADLADTKLVNSNTQCKSDVYEFKDGDDILDAHLGRIKKFESQYKTWNENTSNFDSNDTMQNAFNDNQNKISKFKTQGNKFDSAVSTDKLSELMIENIQDVSKSIASNVELQKYETLHEFSKEFKNPDIGAVSLECPLTQEEFTRNLNASPTDILTAHLNRLENNSETFDRLNCSNSKEFFLENSLIYPDMEFESKIIGEMKNCCRESELNNICTNQKFTYKQNENFELSSFQSQKISTVLTSNQESTVTQHTQGKIDQSQILAVNQSFDSCLENGEGGGDGLASVESGEFSNLSSSIPEHSSPEFENTSIKRQNCETEFKSLKEGGCGDMFDTAFLFHKSSELQFSNSKFSPLKSGCRSLPRNFGCAKNPFREPEVSLSTAIEWAKSIRNLLEDEIGSIVFCSYVSKESTKKFVKCLDFWYACKGLKQQQEDIQDMVILIWKYFINNQKVTILSQTHDLIIENIKKGIYNVNIFDVAQNEVETQLRNTVYQAFLTSDDYHQYLVINSENNLRPKCKNSNIEFGDLASKFNKSPQKLKKMSSNIDSTIMSVPKSYENQLEIFTNHGGLPQNFTKYPTDCANFPNDLPTLLEEPADNSDSCTKLTARNILASVNQRSRMKNIRPEYNAGYDKHDSFVGNRTFPCYVGGHVPSALESEWNSSGACTTDDSKSFTDNSSIDKFSQKFFVPNRKDALREQQKIRENAQLNKETSTICSISNIHVVPRTMLPDQHKGTLANKNPKEFANLVNEGLEKFQQEQNRREKLQKSLLKITQSESSDCTTARREHAQNALPPHLLMSKLHEKFDDDPSKILDDHVARVWDSPSPQSPKTENLTTNHTKPTEVQNHPATSQSFRPIRAFPHMLYQNFAATQTENCQKNQRKFSRYNSEPVRTIHENFVDGPPDFYANTSRPVGYFDSQRSQIMNRAGEIKRNERAHMQSTLSFDSGTVADCSRNCRVGESMSKSQSMPECANEAFTRYEDFPLMPQKPYHNSVVSSTFQAPEIAQWRKREVFDSGVFATSDSGRSGAYSANSNRIESWLRNSTGAFETPGNLSASEMQKRSIAAGNRSNGQLDSPGANRRGGSSGRTSDCSSRTSAITCVPKLSKHGTIIQGIGGVRDTPVHAPESSSNTVVNYSLRNSPLGQATPKHSERAGPPELSEGKRISTQESALTSPIRVVYIFKDDNVPYLIKINCENVTLSKFKQQLHRKGNFRYFFKTDCAEVDGGFILEEITHDEEILPLFQGKIFAQIH